MLAPCYTVGVAGPPIPATGARSGDWLGFVVGIALTIGAVVGLVRVWPEDDARERVVIESPIPTVRIPGVPTDPEDPSLPSIPVPRPPAEAAHLFTSGLPEAVAQLQAAAGDPAQVLELAVYDGYAFLAYRDPANPANIDRRMWRDGQVDDPDPNPIDDRVDADTEPGLFSLDELDLTLLPGLLADAVTRYDLPVAVSHVLVDRFLPFDDRVLIRVYATPVDGRSGGGYVSYDTAGTFVKVCC